MIYYLDYQLTLQNDFVSYYNNCTNEYCTIFIITKDLTQKEYSKLKKKIEPYIEDLEKTKETRIYSLLIDNNEPIYFENVSTTTNLSNNKIEKFANIMLEKEVD